MLSKDVLKLEWAEDSAELLAVVLAGLEDLADSDAGTIEPPVEVEPSVEDTGEPPADAGEAPGKAPGDAGEVRKSSGL